MSECSLMSNRDLLRHVTQWAKLFVEDFLCTANMGVPLLRRQCMFMQNSISLRLEGQSVSGSKEHSFKCNCPHFCQWASS